MNEALFWYFLEEVLLGGPIEPPDRKHRHRCPNPECRAVWEHPALCRGDYASHACPKCGTHQAERYEGKVAPQFRFEGLHGQVEPAEVD